MKTFDNYVDYEKSQQDLILYFYEKQLGFTPDRTLACEDFDFRFEKDGQIYTAEEKFREKDYGDFLLEIMQDVGTGHKGWFYTCKAYFLVYIVEGQFVYFINWRKFKNWIKEDFKNVKFKTSYSNQGYGLTVNLSINWEYIPKSIYVKYIIKKHPCTSDHTNPQP